MSPNDDLCALWTSQPTKEVTPMTIEVLRERSSRMTRGRTRRNWREGVGGVLGIAIVVWFGVAGSPNALSRVGCALLIAGQVVVLTVLWLRGRPRPAPAVSTSTTDYLAYYRGELVRERDLLGSVWSWYIAPIVPGLLLWLVGLMSAIAPHAPPAWTWLTIATTIACGAGIFALIAALNRRASRRLARQIEALDASVEA